MTFSRLYIVGDKFSVTNMVVNNMSRGNTRHLIILYICHVSLFVLCHLDIMYKDIVTSPMLLSLPLSHCHVTDVVVTFNVNNNSNDVVTVTGDYLSLSLSRLWRLSRHGHFRHSYADLSPCVQRGDGCYP